MFQLWSENCTAATRQRTALWVEKEANWIMTFTCFAFPSLSGYPVICFAPQNFSIFILNLKWLFLAEFWSGLVYKFSYDIVCSSFTFFFTKRQSKKGMYIKNFFVKIIRLTCQNLKFMFVYDFFNFLTFKIILTKFDSRYSIL